MFQKIFLSEPTKQALEHIYTGFFFRGKNFLIIHRASLCVEHFPAARFTFPDGKSVFCWRLLVQGDPVSLMIFFQYIQHAFLDIAHISHLLLHIIAMLKSIVNLTLLFRTQRLRIYSQLPGFHRKTISHFLGFRCIYITFYGYLRYLYHISRATIVPHLMLYFIIPKILAISTLLWYYYSTIFNVR